MAPYRAIPGRAESARIAAALTMSANSASARRVHRPKEAVQQWDGTGANGPETRVFNGKMG
jgi:hypothetical protein